jgi:hypothetical protein
LIISTTSTTNQINFALYYNNDGSPEANYFNYVLISAFYVYDWTAKKGLIANQAGFLAAVQSKDVNQISQFFQNAGLVYDPVSNDISSSTGATSEYKIGNIEGVFFDEARQATFESFAIYLLSSRR